MEDGLVWKKELVFDKVNDFTYVSGLIALNSKDEPMIAARISTHYSTGSFKYLRISFISKNASGNWIEEIIASSSDGYFGKDGNNLQD